MVLFALISGAAGFVPAQRFLGARLHRLPPLHLSTADFKNGLTIEMDGAPFKILEFLHVKPGKGSAFVRTKLKNLVQ